MKKCASLKNVPSWPCSEFKPLGGRLVSKEKAALRNNNAALSVVPGAGLEPARLAAGDFESPESTNFTTRAISGWLEIMAQALVQFVLRLSRARPLIQAHTEATEW